MPNSFRAVTDGLIVNVPVVAEPASQSEQHYSDGYSYYLASWTDLKNSQSSFNCCTADFDLIEMKISTIRNSVHLRLKATTKNGSTIQEPKEG